MYLWQTYVRENVLINCFRSLLKVNYRPILFFFLLTKELNVPTFFYSLLWLYFSLVIKYNTINNFYGGLNWKRLDVTNFDGGILHSSTIVMGRCLRWQLLSYLILYVYIDQMTCAENKGVNLDSESGIKLIKPGPSSTTKFRMRRSYQLSHELV